MTENEIIGTCIGFIGLGMFLYMMYSFTLSEYFNTGYRLRHDKERDMYIIVRKEVAPGDFFDAISYNSYLVAEYKSYEDAKTRFDEIRKKKRKRLIRWLKPRQYETVDKIWGDNV